MSKKNENTTSVHPSWENKYQVVYNTAPKMPDVSIGFDKDKELVEKLWDEGGSWDTLEALATEAPSGKEILEAGIDILSLLLKKNISYGNSAIEPLRLFSNASVEEQIMVRIDDKLSRLKNNQAYPGDNDIDDLIGYLILLKVVRRISSS